MFSSASVPRVLAAAILFIFSQQSLSIDPYVLRNIRDCLGGNHTFLCLKEKALDILNRTISSDQPLNVYGVLDIVKDPNYRPNITDYTEVLSNDLQQRSMQLNNMLSEKIDEFVTSRIVKFNLGHIMEGRGKKGKKGGMLMMGGLAMAGMMAQLFMGKIAFMAGAALLVAKLALLLSTIIGFKKLAGSSSGGESHVVYAADSGGGYGHSHGGWQRSHEDMLDLPYSGHVATTQDSHIY